MIPKYKFIIIAFLLLFACLSCEQEERDVALEKVPVIYVFEPVVTDMVDSSPLHLRPGAYCDISIINSKPELIDRLPFSIIESPSSYEDIDFNRYALLLLKFRYFRKPYKIDYTIEKHGDGQVDIYQRFYTTEPIKPDGYYVMSGLLVNKHKLSKSDSIRIWQSSTIEHETNPIP